MISVFIREPEFVGQTKDRLATVEAQNSSKTPYGTISTTGWQAIPNPLGQS